MDTNRFEKSVNLIISDLDDMINRGSGSFTKDDKSEIYSFLLRLNNKSNSFLQKFSIPEIDYSLFHENMIGEKGKINNSRYFRPVEYQFNLLLFLFRNYEEYKDLELRFLIEKFIEKVNDSLRIQDIQVTKTGAVRCKTNIRFALMSLRLYGLINYKDAVHRRNWTPTLLGFFVCIYFILISPNEKNESKFFEMKYLDWLTAHLKVKFLDTNILKLIRGLSIDSNFDNVIAAIDVKHQTYKYIEEFKQLIKNYTNLLNAYYLSKISKKEFTIQINEILIKEEKNIEKFKEELIVNSNQHMLVEKAYEILNKKYK